MVYHHIKWCRETLVDGLFKVSTIVFLFFKKVILARSSESKTVDDIDRDFVLRRSRFKNQQLSPFFFCFSLTVKLSEFIIKEER